MLIFNNSKINFLFIKIFTINVQTIKIVGDLINPLHVTLELAKWYKIARHDYWR